MKTVGAFDAKTHLNALLKRASRGETIRITVRGKPVAMLVPVPDAENADPSLTIRDIRELRKGATLEKISTRELIDEGRRH
jgi:prevent-host-death family protein